MSQQKKYCFGIAFILLFGLTSAFSQNDEAEILKMLQAETEYYLDHSFAELVQKYWILDEHTIMNVTMEDGAILTFDKASLLSMTEIPPKNHATFVKSNHKVYINGNMSIESHNQTVTLENGGKVISLEMRFLEKVNGIWKIHASSVQKFHSK